MPSFLMRIKNLCWYYVHADLLKKNCNTYIICLDEKTGIQALNHPHEGSPTSKGKLKRIEFEYKRNGTIDLLAARSVHDGKIIAHQLSETHNSIDFLNLVKSVMEKIPAGARVVFIADQYSTHLSEDLVRWVAEKVDFKGDLGKKGKKGILKNKKSRLAFLESACFPIRFIYTPKHCSWLNQIETWFGFLQRNLLKDLSCNNVNELKCLINDYINVFNQFWAKSFNWKFNGYKESKLYNNTA